jgi:hypothetical protein
VTLAEITADGALATVLYAVVGAALLALGLAALDLVTPGSLAERLRVDHSPNAGALAVANLTAVTTIVAVAGITSTDDALGEGLGSMAVYGGIGIVLQALLMLVAERGLRGQLDALLRSATLDALAVTLAAVTVALGVVTAVAVS